MNVRVTVPLLTASLFTCAVLACTTTTEAVAPGATPEGSTSSSSSSGSEGPIADESTCRATCERALVRCDVPEPAAEDACASFCGGSPTTNQVACVDRASCEELFSSDSLDELCAGSSSSSSSGGATSSSSSSGSSSGGGTKPTSLKITAKLGNAKPTHILSSDKTKIISALSVGGAPSFSPSKPTELPNVTKPKAVVVSSPALGSCEPSMSFSLNGSQVAVVITATDELPATACATWTDAIASSGLEVSLDDVPYPNGGTADVAIEFSP